MGTINDTDDQTMDAAASAFGQLDEPDDQPREENDDADEKSLDNAGEGGDTSQQDGDEPSDDEQGDEPAPPAIDPPASWDADGRKLFGTLSPEVQRQIVARESSRDVFVRQKASEAGVARQQADGLVAEYQRLHTTFADQLDQYARVFQPQRPDYGLLATDPHAYAQQMARFEAESAQRNDLATRAQAARQQAVQIEQQQQRDAVHRDYLHLTTVIPDYADESKRAGLLREWTATAEAYGYPADRMAQADSADLIALQRATQDRKDAEKYRQITAKVKAGQPKPQPPKVAMPGVAQPRSAQQRQGLQDAKDRLRKTGDVKDAAAAFARLK